MELLFLLPILLGFALVGVFSPLDADDQDAGGGDNSAQDSGGEVAQGTAASDTVSGGAGDDFLLGGSSRDKIEGGSGDDIILGENAADDLYGGRGYDFVLGGAGDDTIQGLNGKDYLIGGAGDDSINGGQGDDLVIGSSGADTLRGNEDNDVVIGLDAGTEAPAVNYPGSPADAETFITQLTADMATRYGDEVDDDLLGRLRSEFANLDTDTADDLLYGGFGNDTVVGDFSDTMTGGAGDDDFVAFFDGTGDDAVVITDFVPAEDMLSIVVPTGTNPAFTLQNGPTLADGVSVVVAGEVVAVLQNIAAADIPNGVISVSATG